MKKNQLRSLDDRELSTVSGGGGKGFLLKKTMKGVGFAAEWVSPTATQQVKHFGGQVVKRTWKAVSAGAAWALGERAVRQAAP